MSKYIGRIFKNDLAGGTWCLETEDGQQYELAGGDAALRQAERRARISGKVRKDVMSIGMSAPVLEVASYELLPD